MGKANQTKQNKESESKRIQRLGIIMTLIGTLLGTFITSAVSIYIYKKQSATPDRVSRASINNSINEIKESFKPDEIPVELDSIPFVKTYREFQTIILEICDDWVLLERNLLYAEPANENDYDVSRCIESVNCHQKWMKKMDDQMKVAKKCIMLLSIESDSVSIRNDWEINVDEFGKLTDLKNLKEIISNKYLSQALQYNNKGKHKRGIMEIERMKNDNDYLSFDDKLFRYFMIQKIYCDKILKDIGNSF